jgi:hypothetical protein
VTVESGRPESRSRLGPWARSAAPASARPAAAPALVRVALRSPVGTCRATSCGNQGAGLGYPRPIRWRKWPGPEGPLTRANPSAAQHDRPAGPVRLGVVVSELRPTR